MELSEVAQGKVACMNSKAMDCAPLNLAHFHERRADKFMRHSRYDEALGAIETSLRYLQEAYQIVTIPKSIEILDSQKWDFERKRREIQLRQNQQERLKSKEPVAPLTETNFRPENINNKPPQLIPTALDQTKVKNIDVNYCEDLDSKNCPGLETKEDTALDPKYCEGFDIKCSENIDVNYCEDADAKYSELMVMSKENLNPRASSEADIESSSTSETEPDVRRVNKKLRLKKRIKKVMKEVDDLPTLEPLELPEFDFSMFANRSLLPGVNTLAESFPN